jgi:hypothetical protein
MTTSSEKKNAISLFGAEDGMKHWYITSQTQNISKIQLIVKHLKSEFITNNI